MARAVSDEEQQLKKRARRRLIGAVVLVAAIVVVLPMVLDSEPRPAGQPVAVRIPSLDSGPFEPKAVAPAAPAESRTESADRNAVPANGKPRPETVAPRPAAQPAKTADSDRSREGRYVVQVIALADAARAKRIREQIAGAGIQSYTEIVKTQKGDVTRVRAGPFASREAAEKARAQLKKLGLSGNITSK